MCDFCEKSKKFANLQKIQEIFKITKVQEIFKFAKSPRNLQIYKKPKKFAKAWIFTQIQKSQIYLNQNENSKIAWIFLANSKNSHEILFKIHAQKLKI